MFGFAVLFTFAFGALVNGVKLSADAFSSPKPLRRSKFELGEYFGAVLLAGCAELRFNKSNASSWGLSASGFD